MQFHLAFFLILAMTPVSMDLSNGDDFVIEFLCAEETTSSPLFSITRADQSDGGLRLFLNTDSPDAVAGLLTAGALQAQLSDHQSETATAVGLALGKAVWCDQDSNPIYLGYRDPLPDCDGKPPAIIRF